MTLLFLRGPLQWNQFCWPLLNSFGHDWKWSNTVINNASWFMVVVFLLVCGRFAVLERLYWYLQSGKKNILQARVCLNLISLTNLTVVRHVVFNRITERTSHSTAWNAQKLKLKMKAKSTHAEKWKRGRWAQISHLVLLLSIPTSSEDATSFNHVVLKELVVSSPTLRRHIIGAFIEMNRVRKVGICQKIVMWNSK